MISNLPSSSCDAGTEQEIPKPQRQGAIIVLGMLAIAKREVVTERVELLLKIGLGQLGMVSMTAPDWQYWPDCDRRTT